MNSHSVAVSTAQLSVRETGTGPAVVLIHAGVTDQRVWSDTVERLADRYRVVTYDRRGFGTTTYETEPHSELADLLAILDFLDIDTAVVAGCSNGGRLALQAATDASPRVSALVVIGSAPERAPGSQAPAPAVDDLFRQFTEAEEAGDVERTNRLEACVWLDGPMQPEGRVGGDARALFFDMNRIALTASPIGDDTATAPQWDQLSGIDVPTLVMVGAYDVPFLVEVAPLMAAAIADAQFVLLPDSGHLPMLDSPEAFATALGAFLDGLHAPATEPDTVTEAAAFLATRGYTDELRLLPAGLGVAETPGIEPLATAIVDYQYRFEGPSDPADEAIVLGVRCLQHGTKGIVISAFGPGADPDETAILRSLARRRG